jgi:hypothetical protein
MERVFWKRENAKAVTKHGRKGPELYGWWRPSGSFAPLRMTAEPTTARATATAWWRTECPFPIHGKVRDEWSARRLVLMQREQTKAGDTATVKKCVLISGALAFVFQEPSLAFHAAAITGEGTVRANDAVTGNDDSNGIGAIRQTDCPDCGWAADAIGEFGVRDGGAERNLSQRLPYLTLKGRAVGFDGQVVDCGQVSGKVVADGAR